ncbi:MAG TPA: hypothetical protein VEE83_01205 [Thermoplasmata archaeon]|nr:hypothetical protein [Thermoplasmata archaeon]
MSVLLATVLEYSALAVSIGLLVFGVALIRVLRLRGGMDLALAHLVADRQRRRLFLAALSVCLAALFVLGLTVSIEMLLGVPTIVMETTSVVLFVIGAVGILVLMNDALRLQALTLQEKWNLEETAVRGTMNPDAVPAVPRWSGPSDAPSTRNGRKR